MAQRRVHMNTALVIGAGPAGLAAAHALRPNAPVLRRSRRKGKAL